MNDVEESGLTGLGVRFNRSTRGQVAEACACMGDGDAEKGVAGAWGAAMAGRYTPAGVPVTSKRGEVP